MEFSLSMTFIDAGGERTAMTVSGVKNTITKDDVTSLMDTIITNNVFVGKGGALVSKYDAQLIQRQTTKFDVQ